MKNLIFIDNILFSNFKFKRFHFKSMGKTVRNEVTKFPDGSKFVSFKHEGGFETDMAKYENINVMVVFYIIKNLD